MLWSQSGGSIRQADAAAAEWGDAASVALPGKLQANSSVVVDGKVVSFEEAWRTTLQASEKCELYTMFVTDWKTPEDCKGGEAKCVVQQQCPLKFLPPSESPIRQILELMSVSTCLQAQQVRFLTEWSVSGGKFQPKGLCIVANRVLAVSKGPQVIIP